MGSAIHTGLGLDGQQGSLCVLTASQAQCVSPYECTATDSAPLGGTNVGYCATTPTHTGVAAAAPAPNVAGPEVAVPIVPGVAVNPSLPKANTSAIQVGLRASVWLYQTSRCECCALCSALSFGLRKARMQHCSVAQGSSAAEASLAACAGGRAPDLCRHAVQAARGVRGPAADGLPANGWRRAVHPRGRLQHAELFPGAGAQHASISAAAHGLPCDRWCDPSLTADQQLQLLCRCKHTCGASSAVVKRSGICCMAVQPAEDIRLLSSLATA